MRRTKLWVPGVVLLAVGLWWLAGRRPEAAAPGREAGNAPTAGVVPAAAVAARDPGVAGGREEIGVVGKREGAGAPSATAGRQTAFRLVMTGDQVALLGADELQGDFHRRRGRLAWLPGMLACRLLDAAQRVVAEETIAAPDRACVVLDPRTPGPDGKPVATTFSPAGPVVFQVRLPKVDSATHLKVYRLTGPRPAGADAEPAGKLLASIALAQ